MKTTKFILTASLFAVMILSACKKDKSTPTPTPNNPPPPANTEEVITTMKLQFTDSASNAVTTFGFQDADGDGGNAGAFMGTNQADSVINLSSNRTYFMEVLLLDVTKNPVDTISKEVEEEGKDHMIFYNQSNPSGIPYTTTLIGSNIKIIYLDIDAGTPARGIGLKTKVRTSAATAGNKFPFKVTLKHQPGAKDGTFTPGETDVEINFKVSVN